MLCFIYKSRCKDNEIFIKNIDSIDKTMTIKFEIKCQRYISKDSFKNDNQKFLFNRYNYS